MKKLILLFSITLFSNRIFSQSKAEKQVSETVETLRKTMIDPDKSVLENITATNLTYGHSNGHLETKTEFIEALVSNKSDFHTIDLTSQSIVIEGKTAVVRHNLTAKTSNNGVPGAAHLAVLLVFQKNGKKWQLLARQAVKI